jgi:alkyl hydroperoxide reductase subunit AhpC
MTSNPERRDREDPGVARTLVGSLAPDFDLPCTPRPGTGRQRACLADFRGRWLALVFYPRDFSLVCPTELVALGEYADEFRRVGCELLAVSCDPIESHEQWIATPRARGGLEGLEFALASDEGGEVARAYGVYLKYQHVALRGLFLIDPNGVLQFEVVHNLSIGRRPEDVFRVLVALQTGGLCAAGWEIGDPNLDPTQVLGPGSMIAHYRIEAPIGSGTFATVFRARDLTLRRTVALKVLKSHAPITPGAALAEARAAAALSHPNICTVFAVEESEGVPIIAMEHVRGRTLNRVLERDGALSPVRAAMVARQIALGMATAHAQGIVHGDLKPENVMVADGDLIKILDFGLARRASKQITVDPDETIVHGVAEAVEGIFGTPSYMSPEQAHGEPATAASDVFALGSILLEMLTGSKAFPGANLLQVLARIRAVDPRQLAAGVPERFSDLLRRLLAADLSQRTITMAEVAERLV